MYTSHIVSDYLKLIKLCAFLSYLEICKYDVDAFDSWFPTSDSKS